MAQTADRRQPERRLAGYYVARRGQVRSVVHDDRATSASQEQQCQKEGIHTRRIDRLTNQKKEIKSALLSRYCDYRRLLFSVEMVVIFRDIPLINFNI